MSSPFPIVDITSSGYPLLESRTELIANGRLESAAVDVIDMLPVRRSSLGPGDEDSSFSHAYTLTPPGTSTVGAEGSDTRCLILWSIFAEGTGGIAAPGELLLVGRHLNPVNIQEVSLDAYIAKRIVIPGPPFHFSTTPEPVDRTMHSGQCVFTGRSLGAVYINSSVAQTRFSLGVYVRPLA